MSEMRERIKVIIQQGFYDMDDGNAVANDITQRVFEAMRAASKSMCIAGGEIGNGAREALIDIVSDLPLAVDQRVATAWAEQVLMELWIRNFKIVTIE